MKKVQDLLSFCRIRPAVHQTEIHPYLQLWDLKEFCEKNGIYMMAYYPLGGAAMMDKEDCLLKNPTIMEIAENHHKTPAQVLIRWCIQRGVICIPKTRSTKRLEENSQVFDFELSEDELQAIRKLDRRQRYSPVAVFLSSKDTRENYYDFEDSYDCLLKDILIFCYLFYFMLFICRDNL